MSDLIACAPDSGGEYWLTPSGVVIAALNRGNHELDYRFELSHLPADLDRWDVAIALLRRDGWPLDPAHRPSCAARAYVQEEEDNNDDSD